jgi:hypothetical protein
MKKSILKNLVILSFAFGALFLITNNINAQEGKEIKPLGISCSWGMQWVGDFSAVTVYCHDCSLYIGQAATGSSGTCM